MSRRGRPAAEGTGTAKRSVTLGLVQMAMGPEREANLERAFALARRARGQGAGLIVFPEIFSGRFFCWELDPRHTALAEPVPGPLCDRRARRSALRRVG